MSKLPLKEKLNLFQINPLAAKDVDIELMASMLSDLTEESQFGICPNCNNYVIGEWPTGEACLRTWCYSCKTFLLEDEVDWE